MSAIKQLSGEIGLAIETCTRRLGSTADTAEQVAVGTAIDELKDLLAALRDAYLFQVAGSIWNVTEILESTVAAARHGPFDGYLAALERHFTRLNRLSGRIHRSEKLLPAIPKRRSKIKGTSTQAAKTNRLSRGTPGTPSSTLDVIKSIDFKDLQTEYQELFVSFAVRPEFTGEVALYLRKLRQGQPNYQLVQQQLGIPWQFVGITHGMECGFNFNAHLHNGDPLSARTIQVPKEMPKTGQPPFTWLQSASDALLYKKYNLVTDWSVPRMLYLFEAYNGWGYRRRGLPTPYLWSFSSHYTKGKFVRDGTYDPQAISKQCGAALMLRAALAA